jgi:hypothetical protein
MIQIDSDSDVDALCAFLADKSCSEALKQERPAQQHVFRLLHDQAKSALGGQCKERLTSILEACSRCCTASESPMLHHTLCIAALQDGQLEDALRAVDILLEETRDSGMHEVQEGGDAAHAVAAGGDAQRKSQHLAACLLRLKIETLVSFVACSPSVQRCL